MSPSTVGSVLDTTNGRHPFRRMYRDRFPATPQPRIHGSGAAQPDQALRIHPRGYKTCPARNSERAYPSVDTELPRPRTKPNANQNPRNVHAETPDAGQQVANESTDPVSVAAVRGVTELV